MEQSQTLARNETTTNRTQSAAYYWCKWDEQWCIATSRIDLAWPTELEGQTVTVTRKNGTTSQQVLGALLSTRKRLIFANAGKASEQAKPAEIQPTQHIQAKPQARLRNTRVIVF